MARAPAVMAVAAVAAVLCGAGGTARAWTAARAVERSARVDGALRSVLSRARAGGTAARTSDEELGVIAAAEISPDGRRIAIVDEVAPNVKIVDEDGNVAMSFHFDHDTAAPYVAPVVAVSNTRLLVLRRDLDRAEVFDEAGRLVQVIARLDFVPETVTALSDSTWLAYGHPRDGARRAAWVRCLYAPPVGAPRWESLLLDTAGTDDIGLPPVLNVSRDGASVRLATRGAPSQAWDVSCGSRPGGVHAERVDIAPAANDRANERASVALLDDAVLAMRVKSAGASFESPARADSTIVELRRRSGRSPPVIVGRDYRIFAHRAGVGVLIGTTSPVPRLYVAHDDALVRAVAGSLSPFVNSQ